MWTIEEVIDATNGDILFDGYKQNFNRVSIDSRKVKPKDLFIAINGIRQKGIHFLRDAILKGISGALVEVNDLNELDFSKNIGITIIIVKDTILALQELALYHRNRNNLKVIAITGSMGKTTTRQIISKISSQKYSTISTKGNMNNQIGLPLTLLNIEKHHRIAVLEIGMNNIGEIERLSQICQPDIGVITNVAPVHLENLGSLKNIAKAKSEILSYISPKGTIILNIDDPLVRGMSEITHSNVLFFGTNKNAHILGKNINVSNRKIDFLLVTPQGHININFPIPSKPMIKNVLAASAVAFLLKCSNKEIKQGIKLFKPGFGRLRIIKTNTNGVEIIDDSYNSNPESLESAIETLNLMKKSGTSLAILGDMMELGKTSKKMHISIGRIVAKYGTDLLYITGRFASYVSDGAKSMNMSAAKIYIGNKSDIIKKVQQNLQTNCVILIKGSRGMEMETITFGIEKIYN